MAQDEDNGYVNYFEILNLDETAKPGEVRNAYRRKMKDLVHEIAQVEITEERRTHYLLEIAKLNASFYVLRDNDLRNAYWTERNRLIALEKQWSDAVAAGRTDTDQLRREFDSGVRDFLAKYLEEAMLDAGRDRDCVEASNWNAAHERHAYRILRHYRQSLYQKILERLPYYEVTLPVVDWDERRAAVAAIMATRKAG
ncbi:MAG: hypothetical protein HZB26_11250 [Candidatus Hydrogenedentes bacterium]|nr:hypothetical protein [Candidatus Hydrogenedentota bacterium]